jgi:hypothetical protein
VFTDIILIYGVKKIQKTLPRQLPETFGMLLGVNRLLWTGNERDESK